MGFNIDWSLLGNAPDPGAALQAGMQQGRALRMQRNRDNALAAYGRNPNDQEAMATLWQADPALAANLEATNQRRSEFARAGDERAALGDYFVARHGGAQAAPAQVAQPNALAGAAPALPVSRPANALASFGSPDLQQVMGISQLSSPAMRPVGTADGQGGPLSMPDAPSRMSAAQPSRDNRSDDALMRLARANPETAFKVQAEGLKTDKARFELAETRLDVIGRLAGSAVDQPTYTAALQRAQSMGIDVSGLPEQFDPAAVRSMQMQALDGKEQLANARAERKLDWDVEDDELDNARDDRNVGSQIETRQGQLANTRRGQDLSDARGMRGQDLSDARGRRGQDLGDARGRRGQDVADARGRRGQDVTDRRGRESASFKGTGGRGGRTGTGTSGGSSGARIIDPRTKRAAIVKNGKWVDEVTGKPLS